MDVIGMVNGMLGGLFLREGFGEMARHYQLLLGGLLPGTLAGLVLALPLGVGLKRSIYGNDGMAVALTLFPWRTLVLAGAVLGLTTATANVGLGFFPALYAAAAFGAVAAVGIGAAGGARSAVSDSIALNGIRTLRTVVVFGGGFILCLAMIGAGGAGNIMLTGLQRLHVQLMFEGAGQAITLSLLPDLLLGGIQASLTAGTLRHADQIG